MSDSPPSPVSDTDRSPFMTDLTMTKRVKGLMTYVHRPEQDRNPELAVVIVHQCTALGGCALAAEDIASAVCDEGLLTVSFDLRGAGESSGCCCLWPIPCISGCPEVSDVLTIAQWVKEKLGRDSYILGVSAGGPIGIGALDRLPCIRGYTSVACTLGVATNLLFGPRVLAGLLSRKPKLFIMGTADIFTSVAAYKLAMRLARQPRTAVLIPGAGHFDLEYRPLARLDARLVADFIGAGGTLPARLEGGAVHLASYRRWLWPSLFNCGPLYLILAMIGLFVYVHRPLTRYG